MSSVAIVVMVVVCGLVWGGFAVLLSLALRRERDAVDRDADGRRRES